RRRVDRRVGSARRTFPRAVDEEHGVLRSAHFCAGAAAAGHHGAAGMTSTSLNPRGRALLIALLAVLLAAPLVADRYLVSVLILFFFFAFFGRALNLVMGFAGQVS